MKNSKDAVKKNMEKLRELLSKIPPDNIIFFDEKCINGINLLTIKYKGKCKWKMY